MKTKKSKSRTAYSIASGFDISQCSDIEKITHVKKIQSALNLGPDQRTLKTFKVG